MRPPRDLRAALALALLLPAGAAAEPARDTGHGLGIFDGDELGNRKEPITVTSDTLEYDYKNNVVVYRGEVLAVQGTVKVRSDTLTVTFAQADTPPAAAKTPAAPAAAKAPAVDDAATHKLRDIVAVGSVRIDHGTRWATGGHAVFDQTKRTVVLTENPVLHDGSNEVAGDRVVVYLDEDRSVVEGGRKRVKAVLYPGKDGGLVPADDTKTPPEGAGPTAQVASP
jgi:lipopolysaccharide export system protein LptA